jgi:cell division septation protein DedD
LSEEAERSDTYYEVQVDRETLVLLGFGFVALLVAAFLVGRWTAPAPAAGGEQAAALGELAGLGGDEPSPIDGDGEDVDGEPLFGGSPVSAEGAPPIGAVPAEPLPEAVPAKEPEGKSAAESVARAKPKPATETASRVASPPVADEGWVVQVSAVKSSRDAKQLQEKLQAKGWPVRVQRESGFSKVQVGPFAKRSEADAAERRLKREDGLSTWVKRS